MTSSPRAGFSLLEFTVVLVVISFVLVALSHRITRLQAAAEIAQMDYVVRALRGALALEIATAVAANRRSELHHLLGSNPMKRLAEPPENYLGELKDPAPERIAGGHWYFDRGERVLVYRVRNAHRFSTDLAGPPRARFKFTAVHSDPSSSVDGLQLAPAEPYRWVHAPAAEE